MRDVDVLAELAAPNRSGNQSCNVHEVAAMVAIDRDNLPSGKADTTPTPAITHCRKAFEVDSECRCARSGRNGPVVRRWAAWLPPLTRVALKRPRNAVVCQVSWACLCEGARSQIRKIGHERSLSEAVLLAPLNPSVNGGGYSSHPDGRVFTRDGFKCPEPVITSRPQIAKDEGKRRAAHADDPLVCGVKFDIRSRPKPGV